MPSQPLEFFISFDVLKSQTSWGIFSMNLGKAAMFVPRFWVSWQDWYQTLVSVFPNSVLFYQETMRPPDRTDGRQFHEFKIAWAQFRGRHVHGVSWKVGTPVWESILAKWNPVKSFECLGECSQVGVGVWEGPWAAANLRLLGGGRE